MVIVVTPERIKIIPINTPVATTGITGRANAIKPSTVLVIGLINDFVSLVTLSVNIRVDKPVIKSQIPRRIGISFTAPSVLFTKMIPNIKPIIELPIE